MKGNSLYIIVAMVAVGLIGITIGLQLVILFERPQVTLPENASTADAEVALAASTIEKSTFSFMQPTPASQAMPVATAASGATVAESIAGAPDAAERIPMDPASSAPDAAQANAAPETQVAEADTAPQTATAQRDSAQTDSLVATAVATLSAASGAPAPSLDTDSLQSNVDFSIGYVDERNACSLISEIIAEILETEFASSVRRISFANTDLMYQNMAEPRNDPARSIQLTPCYIDPADRTYLRTYNTTISLIGDAYREVETNKYYVASHAGLTPNLEFHTPCVLHFLRTLNFQELNAIDMTASQWIADNADLVTSWTQCN